MTETNYAGQPRYCQIRDDLMTAIREQRLRPNEQIPTEVEIMRQYGVSRTTVRRAIQDLVDNGILVKRQGTGTFVNAPRYTRNLLRFISFTSDCLDHGYTPSTEVSDIDYVDPSPELAEKLQMREGEKMYVFHRLRFIDGEPVMIEFNKVPERFDFIPHCGKEGLHSLMRLFQHEHGIKAERYESVLEASFATKSEAAMLNIREGAVVFVIEGICYSGNHPMYFFKQIISAERCKLDVSGYNSG